MKQVDLLLQNAQVVLDDRVIDASLAVSEGKIVSILDPEVTLPAAETLDLGGLTVLPGVVDSHVHLRDPGRVEREDFTTGTAAAAAGGITTILEQPISIPAVSTAEVFKRRIEIVQPKALVDFALYGAAGSDNVAEIPRLAEAGAIAFKTFLHAPIPGREHEFVGLCCPDDGALYDVFRAVKDTGLRSCLHAEDNSLVERLTQQLKEAGRVDGRAHAEGRPEVAENVSVAKVLALAESVGVSVGICHMSSARAVEMVMAAKQGGMNVTAETCPQYLFLNEDALAKWGPFAKCNPPVRKQETVEKMLQLTASGGIDIVGSDHSPYVPMEKERGIDNIWNAPAGFPGLEVLLPLMLDAVNKGRFTLPQVAQLVAGNTARIFNLPHKGRIAVGYDADLAVVDMNAEWTVDWTQLLTKARETAKVWDGLQLKGKVVKTLVRGKVVFENGEIKVQPGYGHFVTPGM